MIAAGSVSGARAEIGDQRRFRRDEIRVSSSASRHRVGGRLHQRAMEGRGDRQRQRALGALQLGELHRALDRRLRARDRRPARRRCRWPPRRSRRSDRVRAPPRARSPTTAGKSSPSIAAIAPSPTGTAFCIACPRTRNSRAASSMVRAPAAQSAEYSPSEWPATKAASRPTSSPASLSSARSAARLVAIRAGCALAVRVSSASGPSKIKPAEAFAQRRVDALEHFARGRKRLGERLAHADRLRALPGKYEGRCHPRSLLRDCTQLRAGRDAERRPLSSAAGKDGSVRPPLAGRVECDRGASSRREFGATSAVGRATAQARLQCVSHMMYGDIGCSRMKDRL